MKLFKIEVRFKNRRRRRSGVDLVVHAKSKAAAEAHVRSRFQKCEIVHALALPSVSKHFVIAELVDE